MTENVRTTRPFAIYALGVACAGAAALLASWVYYPPIMNALFFALLAATVATEFLSIYLPGEGSATPLAYALAMAAMVLFGPAAAGTASVLSSLDWHDIRQRRPLSVWAFNIGQLALAACAAGWIYMATGGRTLVQPVAGGWEYAPLSQADLPAILLPLLLAALVGVAINDLIVSFGVHLYTGAEWSKVLYEGVMFIAPRQLALAAVGFSIAQVLSISRPAFILFLVPLVVARQVFQHALTLRAAYLDTIRGLVRAVEAKDPYTSGHSMRVARYARSLGGAVALNPRQLDNLEYAALLHDIGKIGIPISVLTKPARLSNEEYALIQQHPRIGAQIVSKVPYLENIVDTVLFHHEHFDGRGYGEGAAGEEIPILARIMSVADAYDAMTSERPYRQAMTPVEAADEVGRCSGTQFDPALADAFISLVRNADPSLYPAEGRDVSGDDHA